MRLESEAERHFLRPLPSCPLLPSPSCFLGLQILEGPELQLLAASSESLNADGESLGTWLIIDGDWIAFELEDGGCSSRSGVLESAGVK